MLRPAAYQRAGATSASRQGLLKSLRDRRGLLSGILESVGDFLGFGNDQAHPSDPNDPGSGATSTPGSHGPTSVQSPTHQPSQPAQVPPASYPAPGGGGQGDRPTSPAPASVSSTSSGSAGTVAEPAPHSSSPPDAMNAAPSVSPTPLAHASQHVADIYGGTATSHTAAPGWPSNSSSVSSAPSPTDPPTTPEFPLAAAAAIGAVLGFLVVSALFWAVWLAQRKRRAYPEFASVHPQWVSVQESVGVRDENPFTDPRDEKEDNPFDAASPWRASTPRSVASTLSV